MSPFFNERHNETSRSDVCLMWKWYAQRNLQRGMIITFHNPLKPDALTTKRIVGLPGDLIHTRPPFTNPYIRVPPNHVWVEGDEGGKLTQDSNMYGPISIRLIQGQVTHILWPWRKAGRVRWWEHPDRLGAFRQ
ncbi:LexA/Signal peptidase [Cryphonectria parasitica EP155]|uniref:LexA/Signal peptidase n=1 Tax=Cryphonectria parasitica (strain ATCC 38755 / EP155) TaxID=660469 RepID=A0A9P5CRT6_CRYP1|nr:LexA/Signal peptidase [Cryphonectria parasitica EP155]KAF3767867.1 LexA/Signal peptidase [Cryphonectria parasitica EP155]